MIENGLQNQTKIKNDMITFLSGKAKESDPTEETHDGLALRTKSKKRKYFKLWKSIKTLERLLNFTLPTKDECIKLISYDGGFSSISFIAYVAERERISKLTASTLRVGEKQFRALNELRASGKLDDASFYIGSIMKEDAKLIDDYDYFTHFEKACADNGWKMNVINNHSKLILMRTQNNWYVLETSSNLNENPKIEQYSLENDETLYKFYDEFFSQLG